MSNEINTLSADLHIRSVMDNLLNPAIAQSSLSETEFLRRVIAVSQEYGHDTFSAVEYVLSNPGIYDQ